MKTTVNYVILTAFRDWLFSGLLGLLLLVYAVSYLFAGTSIVEESKAATAFSAGASRLLMVTGLIVFSCFHLRRGFETKEIDIILTKPLSRFSFIISYWLGLSSAAVILTVAASLMVMLVGHSANAGFFAWSLSLILECVLVVTLSLAVSLIFKSAVASVMGCLCFYVMARMAGFFVSMIDSAPASFSGISSMGAIGLKFISVFIPRMDQFTQSSWLVYGLGSNQEFLIVALQSLIYIPLLIGLAYYDFRRRQF